MQSTDILTASCLFLDKLLEQGEAAESSIANRIRKSDIFSRLVNAEALVREKRGRGAVWKIAKREVVQAYRYHECPSFTPDETRGERYNRIRATRDSKSSPRESYRLIFARSSVPFTLNGQTIVAQEAIGRSLESITAKKVCFVENLENFMRETKLIDKGYVLLFPVGRLGMALFERIIADAVMHFGDLDYVGLNEYARVNGFFPDATLYIPNNYFENALKNGKTITKKQAASSALLRLCEKDRRVKSVYDFIQRHNLFLEQEGYDG